MTTAELRPPRVWSRPTALYRLYGGGVLLYAGITADVRRRLGQHAREQPWWADVDRVVVIWCPDRWVAEGAEAIAVALDRPLHNHHKQELDPQVAVRFAERWARKKCRHARALSGRASCDDSATANLPQWRSPFTCRLTDNAGGDR